MPGVPSGVNHSSPIQAWLLHDNPSLVELVVEAIEAVLEPRATDRDAEILERS